MGRFGALLLAVAVLAAGCGSDSDTEGSGSDSDGSSAGGVLSAVLAIISTNIETDTGGGFGEASEGEELVVGDRVRTDPTGFAEVTYHDGSWMRVESSATLTIEDLADTDSGEVVSTSIDTGDAWARVRELTEPDDGFELDTPVASATVRGTAFAVSCEGDASCTFSVVEGEVLVTPDVGEPVTLVAGQSLTVTGGEEPPSPQEPGVEALEAEPFIATNLELDETKAGAGGEADTGDDEAEDSDEQGAGAPADSASGKYEATVTYTLMEGRVGSLAGRPEAGTTVSATLFLSGDCDGEGPCTVGFIPADPPLTISAPPTELEPSGGGYTGSNTSSGGDSCPIDRTDTWELSIDGDVVTGTYISDPETTELGDCYTNRFAVDFEASPSP